MRKPAPQPPERTPLLLTAAEPAARRIVAKKHGIKSGAVPVLAALVARADLRLTSRPKDLYSAKIAGEKLVRGYLRGLVLAGLVADERHRGLRTVRPTLRAYGVMGDYHRALRGGARALAEV